MSLQANYCIQLLMLFYAELDQRTGWADRARVIQSQKEKGIAEGRTENGLNSLIDLKMLELRTEGDRSQLRLSNYGVDWFEKHFELIERGEKSYQYEWSPFRKIRLVPPEVFYGRKSKHSHDVGSVNWTKWGTIFGALGVFVSVALWKFS